MFNRRIFCKGFIFSIIGSFLPVSYLKANKNENRLRLEKSFHQYTFEPIFVVYFNDRKLRYCFSVEVLHDLQYEYGINAVEEFYNMFLTEIDFELEQYNKIHKTNYKLNDVEKTYLKNTIINTLMK